MGQIINATSAYVEDNGGNKVNILGVNPNGLAFQRILSGYNGSNAGYNSRYGQVVVPYQMPLLAPTISVKNNQVQGYDIQFTVSDMNSIDMNSWTAQNLSLPVWGPQDLMQLGVQNITINSVYPPIPSGFQVYNNGYTIFEGDPSINVQMSTINPGMLPVELTNINLQNIVKNGYSEWVIGVYGAGILSLIYVRIENHGNHFYVYTGYEYVSQNAVSIFSSNDANNLYNNWVNGNNSTTYTDQYNNVYTIYSNFTAPQYTHAMSPYYIVTMK